MWAAAKAFRFAKSWRQFRMRLEFGFHRKPKGNFAPARCVTSRVTRPWFARPAISQGLIWRKALAVTSIGFANKEMSANILPRPLRFCGVKASFIVRFKSETANVNNHPRARRRRIDRRG